MISVTVEDSIQNKYRSLNRELDERLRRLWAATEAESLGHGGVTAVSRATGLAESTIRIGCRELRRSRRKTGNPHEEGRIRREGAGRRRIAENDPGLSKALKSLVESTTRGDPMSPLRWTCKSTRNLAEELTQQGHAVGHSTVAEVLKEMGYSLQGTRKSLEGKEHPDRNEQFEYINEQVKDFQGAGQPVISVDCKKKENIGQFHQPGREYHRRGRGPRVRSHDFPDEECMSGCLCCDLTMCHGCLSACEFCKEPVCTECLSECIECGNPACTSCCENELCPDCIEAKEQNDDNDENKQEEPTKEAAQQVA